MATTNQTSPPTRPPKLSVAQTRILAMIVARPTASMGDLVEVMKHTKGSVKNPKGHPTGSVRTTVCDIRRKLKPYGIEIETQRGEGYYMTMRNKHRLKMLYRGPDAPPTAARRVNGS